MPKISQSGRDRSTILSQLIPKPALGEQVKPRIPILENGDGTRVYKLGEKLAEEAGSTRASA